ncbi:hypothetical protein AAC03nite_35450 [Alicyclobacillus acidoterrestris]|uniref:hypothetical protein n=1 Tax=Alicyclobacillus suci TaxID=2816080 RepID=UPI00038554F5|nr:hypothetical protein [Alicyclobacillus suci]EPZ47898.1 hypothetical protein N007_04885 [Alicyclobacillus acidoterrestris ATCC 49025]GEO27760.1 hypothetical protein AAC03nite_35450 [Alicyclobacillus acidoterrestris]
MITLITRWWWTVITLILLPFVLFLIQYAHDAALVQDAANNGRMIAAVTADPSSLTNEIVQNISESLPTTQDGTTLFNPNTDIVTRSLNANQEVEVSVTYHMPVFGGIGHYLGIGGTIPITRTTIQSLDYPQNGLNAVLQSAPPSSVNISSVSLQAAGTNFSLTVNGTGFGSAPNGVPGTVTGTFFVIADVTQGWDAGSPQSGLAVTYASWNDTQIELSGIQNYGKGTERINPGDDMYVTVSTSNGSNTYYFVANTTGTTQYSASISASNTTPSIGTAVTITASSGTPGDGTNGIGIYDATTGQYLIWSASGESVSQSVNSGSSSSQDYVAYYGPQGQIANALATSDDLGVTWAKTSSSGTVTAVMMQTSDGAYIIDIFGQNLSGATVSGSGLSGTSQVSSNEIQVNANDSSDSSGEVTLANGEQVTFQAQAY